MGFLPLQYYSKSYLLMQVQYFLATSPILNPLKLKYHNNSPLQIDKSVVNKLEC